VLGLDLDGCVADFVGSMRKIYAEWSGKPKERLDQNPIYGFPEWGLIEGEYEKLHRFAITQKDLFLNVFPIDGAAQSLRRLSTEGIWIRVATHRIFIPNFHAQAANQTIKWLEKYDIRYWDLCLIQDKAAVFANLFVEDSPVNIKRLEKKGIETICFTNSINKNDTEIAQRAANWEEAEELIRQKYYVWREKQGLSKITNPGTAPDEESGNLSHDGYTDLIPYIL